MKQHRIDRLLEARSLEQVPAEDAEGKERDDNAEDGARFVERRLLVEFPEEFLKATS